MGEGGENSRKRLGKNERRQTGTGDHPGHGKTCNKGEKAGPAGWNAQNDLAEKEHISISKSAALTRHFLGGDLQRDLPLGVAARTGSAGDDAVAPVPSPMVYSIHPRETMLWEVPP